MIATYESEIEKLELERASGVFLGVGFENGALDKKKFEQFSPQELEELFQTFEDWNTVLKNSDFESWLRENPELVEVEPQP